MKNKVLIMAGGTGGHVFPGLAIANEFKERGFNVEWLGTKLGLESSLVPQNDIPIHYMQVKGVRGKGVLTLLQAPFNIILSIVESFRILKRIDPELIIGFGGFVSGPGGVSAWLLKRTLVIHEQNAIAGTTNRILSRISKKVFSAFPVKLRRSIYVGNPVRKEIEALAGPETRGVGKERFIRLLVLGGSRGAKAINELVPRALKKVDNQISLKITHQAGSGKDEQTRNLYKELHIDAEVTAFLTDISSAYMGTDIVICRAGALTVSEIACVGVGAIFIPFPYAIDDHQTANAQFLVDQQAAIVVQERDTDEEKLSKVLNSVLKDHEKILRMAINARKCRKENVSRNIVDICQEVMDG